MKLLLKVFKRDWFLLLMVVWLIGFSGYLYMTTDIEPRGTLVFSGVASLILLITYVSAMIALERWYANAKRKVNPNDL